MEKKIHHTVFTVFSEHTDLGTLDISTHSSHSITYDWLKYINILMEAMVQEFKKSEIYHSDLKYYTLTPFSSV